MNQLIVVLDTETTGTDPATDRVVELAMVPLTLELVNEYGDGSAGDHHAWTTQPGVSTLVNPERDISVQAKAVHHITEADVINAPTLERAVWKCMDVVPDEAGIEVILAAHNASFDASFLPMFEDYKWLDTWRIALHLYPDAPSHSNQVLRYYLDLKPELPADLFPHRALYDTIVTASILQHMLEAHSVSELLALSTKPVILKTCRFGKHSGKLWSEIPYDYLQWASRQDFDGDTKYTIEHYLNRSTVKGPDL